MKKQTDKNKVHYSSASNEWATPSHLFKRIEWLTGGHFDLDPCCTHATAKCHFHFTQEDDGLTMPWGAKRAFMNPPYGREIGKWIKKAYEEHTKRGIEVVCLIPSRTDTEWWHEYCMIADRIVFIQGRIEFEQNGKASKVSAPFPSCLVIFNGKSIDKHPKISSMSAT